MPKNARHANGNNIRFMTFSPFFYN
ncbi:protein of unknown function (plasmid) [Shinella sp. WSC3-e]|nr:protein of unknown function [Shinella sp. WSC3-e]